MRYLLDTNVVSEFQRRAPERRVLNWVASRDPAELCLSVITVFELELGIARLARREPDRATKLAEWMQRSVLHEFRHATLPIEVEVARRAASLHVPDPRPERDALIAATALVHGCGVVTRNVADFEPMGVFVINPWE